MTTTGILRAPTTIDRMGRYRGPKTHLPHDLEPELIDPVILESDNQTPREPLPLAQVLVNLRKLDRDLDPTVRALAGQFDLVEYHLATAEREAWERRG